MIMLLGFFNHETYDDLRKKTFYISQKEIRPRFKNEAIMSGEKHLSHGHEVVYSPIYVGYSLRENMAAGRMRFSFECSRNAHSGKAGCGIKNVGCYRTHRSKNSFSLASVILRCSSAAIRSSVSTELPRRARQIASISSGLFPERDKTNINLNFSSYKRFVSASSFDTPVGRVFSIRELAEYASSLCRGANWNQIFSAAANKFSSK